MMLGGDYTLVDDSNSLLIENVGPGVAVSPAWRRAWRRLSALPPIADRRLRGEGPMSSLILSASATASPAKYDGFQDPDAYRLVVPDVTPDTDR
jgi:hypothetical protein